MDTVVSYTEAFRQLTKLLRDTARRCNCPFLTEGAEKLDAIAANSRRPFEVAFFGRMKTGKSSLINAYIGQSLAITGVEEATATINKLSYGNAEQCKTFTVHWKDRLPEAQTFPLESLQTEWNGKTAEVLDRIRQTSYLELYSPVEALRHVHIIDTPGTGSAATEHEDMAQQFISGRQTDALVYVFPPVGRETDENSLATFRKGCVDDSTPYNSVAVLHKWDHIYWNNGGDMDDIRVKAERVHNVMEKMVAEVVPVSAPLALAVRTLPEEIWPKFLALLPSFDSVDDLKKKLSMEPLCKIKCPAAYALYHDAHEQSGLPWASFQILVRHLYLAQPPTPEAAKESIEALSGIRQLEELVERRFFRRSALLQQRKMRADAQAVFNDIDDKIGEHLRGMRDERDKLDRAAHLLENAPQTDASLVRWLGYRAGMMESMCRELEKRREEIDRIRIATEEQLKSSETALDILPWLDEHGQHFSTEEETLARTLLNDGPGGVKPTSETLDLFENLCRKASRLALAPDPELRRPAEKLAKYLNRAAMALYDD